MLKLLRRISLCFCLVGIPLFGAQANPFDIYGGDLEAQSMAGAFSALADRSTGAYYNPGALGAMRLDEVRIAGFAQTGNFKFNGKSNNAHPTRGYFLSAGTPFHVGGQKWGFGFSSFVPSDTVLNLVSRDPRDPHFLFYDRYPNRLTLYFAMGWEMIEGVLSVGAGFQGFINITGEIQANVAFINQGDQAAYLSGDPCGPNPDPKCEVAPGEMPDQLQPSLFFNQTQDVSATPTAGLLLTPTPSFRFAFSWRDSFYVGLSLPQDSNTEIPLAGSLRLAMAIDMDTYYQPETWTVGIAYSPDFEPDAETYAISADLAYREFSQYISHELLFSVTNIPELESTTPYTVIEKSAVHPNFRDTLEIRLGWRQRISPQFQYMAGWAFIPSPVPTQNGASNILDSDKHLISAGLSHNLSWMGGEMEKVDLLLSSQLHLLQPQRYAKTDPLDYIGRRIGFHPDVNPLLAGPEDRVVLDPGVGRGRISGWAGALSLGVRLRLD